MDIALVHGSYHGAWCWDRLMPELEALGHRVIAADLPISDPTYGASAYADAVIAAIASMPEPMLVGHSMGGLVTPIVAARRPIRRLVFLAAFLPVPGLSANDQRATEALAPDVAPATAEWTDLGDDVWMVGPNTAREVFYHDAPPAVAAWAAARLRPQCYRVMSETTPLEAWPAIESRAIVCRDDRAINADWVRSASRTRLGVEAVEIDGAHSPFMTRPAELAAILDTLA